MTEYWGGTIHFFLLTLYNFKNIGGGARGPPSWIFKYSKFFRIQI